MRESLDISIDVMIDFLEGQKNSNIYMHDNPMVRCWLRLVVNSFRFFQSLQGKHTRTHEPPTNNKVKIGCSCKPGSRTDLIDFTDPV